jgi:hypothetical protein
MFKTASAALACVALGAAFVPAAKADGFYVNPEYNLGFAGNQTAGGGAIDAHVGYEAGPWYIQGGPQIVFPEGGETDYQFSAKTGLSADVTKDGKLGIYTEVSMATGDKSNSYGLKLGSKYKF